MPCRRRRHLSARAHARRARRTRQRGGRRHVWPPAAAHQCGARRSRAAAGAGRIRSQPRRLLGFPHLLRPEAGGARAGAGLRTRPLAARRVVGRPQSKRARTGDRLGPLALRPYRRIERRAGDRDGRAGANAGQPRGDSRLPGRGSMIEAQNLSVSYGRHVALSDISIKLERGSITVVLGANGAGKTTLVRTLAGLVRPTAGRILLDGRDITAEPPHRRVALRLSTVPQDRGLFPDMSVEDNLALGGFVARGAREVADRCAAVYRLFPRLAERRKQAAETMSGGEQQMLAIGRALMAKPAYLLLDEPSLGLSPVLVSELFRTVRKIADRGVGVLLVEQNALQSLKIG